MKELSNLILSLHRSCREMAVDRYQQWALEELKTRVSFDAALWASAHFDPDARGPVVHNVVLANRPLAMMAHYESIKDEDPLASEVRANPGVSCAINALPHRPGASREFRDYLVKWKIINAVSKVVVDPLSGLLTAISLYRESYDAPFTETERRFHDDAMPHLIDTYVANRLAHLIRAAHPRNAAIYASAVADRLGQLQIAPDGFQRLLLAEWPAWRGSRLPRELRHLIGHKSGCHFVGRRIYVRLSAADGVFLAQAREKRPADELTTRELQVARLAAKGLTYGQVGKRLGISPATVRNHLSAVYGKLGVRKQAELVSLLHDVD